MELTSSSSHLFSRTTSVSWPFCASCTVHNPESPGGRSSEHNHCTAAIPQTKATDHATHLIRQNSLHPIGVNPTLLCLLQSNSVYLSPVHNHGSGSGSDSSPARTTHPPLRLRQQPLHAKGPASATSQTPPLHPHPGPEHAPPPPPDQRLRSLLPQDSPPRYRPRPLRRHVAHPRGAGIPLPITRASIAVSRRRGRTEQPQPHPRLRELLDGSAAVPRDDRLDPSECVADVLWGRSRGADRTCARC